MQQIIVIGGGTTFSNYEHYLQFLANKPVYIERLTYQPMWKELLQQNLGDGYQVISPRMPNTTNAKYAEWKLWFQNISQLAADNCILVGHSLGAIFLAKFLSENEFPVKIQATILVAAPYNDETDEDLTDFKLTGISDRFTKQAGNVIFYAGSDDPVIASTELEKYRTALPSAEFNILPAPDHFVRADFPEIVARIKSL